MTIVAALAEVLKRENPSADISTTGDRLTAVITARTPTESLAEPVTVRAREADLLPGLAGNREMSTRSWPLLDLEHACAEMPGVHVDEVLATQRPGERELVLADAWRRPSVSPARPDPTERSGWKLVGSESGDIYGPDGGSGGVR